MGRKPAVQKQASLGHVVLGLEQHEPQPQGHRFAVQPRMGGRREMGFDRVTDGVPQVELGAGAALVQIGIDHGHFGSGRLLESCGPSFEGVWRCVPSGPIFEVRLAQVVVEHGVFGHFRKACPSFAIGQGDEPPSVEVHEFRKGEGAELVLGPTPVDAGFAAPGGVDHGQGGRGHVRHTKPTLPNCGGQPHGVAQRASPTGQHQGRPGEAVRLKRVEEVGHRVPALQGFSAFEFQNVPTARARAVQRAGVLRKHLWRQARFTHPQHAVGVCRKKLGKGKGKGVGLGHDTKVSKRCGLCRTMQGIGRERRILCAQLDAMKKVFVAWMALSSVLSLAQAPDFLPQEDLIAWYAMGAGSMEESGLVPLQPVVFAEDRFGEADECILFDGEQELTTAGLSYSDFTISLWFRGEASSEDVCHGLISQNMGVDCTPLMHVASCNIPPAIRCQVRTTSCVADQVSAELNVLSWQHLVFQREGNTIRTFLNGDLAEEGAAIEEDILPDVPLRIGSLPYGGQFRGFNGLIDDVAIWGRSLSEEEVFALHQAEQVVVGCQDVTACNYNPEANMDSGMCDFGPELELVAELIACDSTATIDAGEGYAAYAWSTGDSTQTTEVAQSGTYEVEVWETGGQSLHFDGENDHVACPPVTDQPAAFTVSATVKIESHSMGKNIVEQAQNGQWQLGLLENFPDQMGFGIKQGSSWSFVNVPVILNQWIELTGVYNRAAGTLEIFVDGQLQNTTTGLPDAGMYNYSGWGLEIGGRTGGRTLDGNIARVLVWERDLNAEELSAHLGCDVPVSSQNLVAHFDFGGGDGDVATDLSGEGNDGSILGATFVEDSPCLGCSSQASIDVVFGHGSCFCGEGTIWDALTGTCVVANVSDTDFDGCVGINDFLIHLSNFGSGCGPEPAWSCGDPLEYQGYDYETVQIGEQCWFAENLRAAYFQNGELIPQNLTHDEWTSSAEPACAIYGEQDSPCQEELTNGPYCALPDVSLTDFGRLYRGTAVMDDRGLCPTGWSVPSDSEFLELEMYAGLEEVEAGNTGWRGDGVAAVLKSNSGWYENGNGVNSANFDSRPAGYRGGSGHRNAGGLSYFWTSSAEDSMLWRRVLSWNEVGVLRDLFGTTDGFSVRCIQNVE